MLQNNIEIFIIIFFRAYLKFLRIVHSWDGLHQVGGGVVAKVRAYVTHTQSSTACLQILWMLISWFVQCIYLWEDHT